MRNLTGGRPASGAPGERHSRVISQKVKIQVSARDQGRCVLCGSTEDLHYDHKIPWSRGGTNTVNNIQLMCGSCNRAKGADDVGPLYSGSEYPEPERASLSDSQTPVPGREPWEPRPGWGTVREFQQRDNGECSYWFVFDDGNKVGPFRSSGDDAGQILGEYARGVLVRSEGLTVKVPGEQMRRMEEEARRINGMDRNNRILMSKEHRDFAADFGWAWTSNFTLVKAAPGLLA